MIIKKSTILSTIVVLCVATKMFGSDGKPVELPEGVDGLAAVLFTWGADPEVHRLWTKAAADYEKTVAALKKKQKDEGLTQEQGMQKYGEEAIAAIQKKNLLMWQGADRIKIAARRVDETTEAKENKKKNIVDELKKDAST